MPRRMYLDLVKVLTGQPWCRTKSGDGPAEVSSVWDILALCMEFLLSPLKCPPPSLCFQISVSCALPSPPPVTVCSCLFSQSSFQRLWAFVQFQEEVGYRSSCWLKVSLPPEISPFRNIGSLCLKTWLTLSRGSVKTQWMIIIITVTVTHLHQFTMLVLYSQHLFWLASG